MALAKKRKDQWTLCDFAHMTKVLLLIHIYKLEDKRRNKDSLRVKMPVCLKWPEEKKGNFLENKTCREHANYSLSRAGWDLLGFSILQVGEEEKEGSVSTWENIWERAWVTYFHQARKLTTPHGCKL